MAYRAPISFRRGEDVFKYYPLSSGRIDLGRPENASSISKSLALYSGEKGASRYENRTPDFTRNMGLTRVPG